MELIFKKICVSFLFLPVVVGAFAGDFSQHVDDNSAIKEFEEKIELSNKVHSNDNDDKEGSAHLGGHQLDKKFQQKLDQDIKNEDDDNNKKFQSSHLTKSSKEELLKTEYINDKSSEVIDGGFDHQKNYQEYRNEDILSKQFNRARYSYSLTMIKDTYDYSDDRNVFKRTFEYSSEGKKIGGFHIEYRNYFSKGFINPHLGFALGLGHSRGKGLFQDDSSLSRATFQIWTFPIDFWLGMELPMGSFFKVSVAGGPSVLPILQNRSDRVHSDHDKEYGQIGSGYSGIGKIQFNFSRISSSAGFGMLSNYDISNFYLDFAARYQSYENFKDNITVSGASFGLGFTFEYL